MDDRFPKKTLWDIIARRDGSVGKAVPVPIGPNKLMRKFLLAILLMLGIVFILGRISEVESMVETLQHGDWRFLLLAAILMMVWLVVNGALYRTIFQTLGIVRSLEEMFMVSAAANFANIVAPAAGASGLAVLVADARRRGS